MNTFTNPVLPGGFPDPSICRVGDDYYVVNSSFEFFPGLPIHHSRDLVNWELIGYALDRPEQCIDKVCLTDVQSDGGIHAPTLRYHDGLFYIITTNVYKPQNAPDTYDPCTNFIVTAKDPAGPWSEPKVITGAPGIDPDIFFDDDGRVWYVGTHTPEDQAYPGEGEIWLQELNLENTTLVGERHFLWRGTGGDWVEGPHLYKYRGRYFLMTAEGGTGFNHAITIASSEKITGPYKSNPRNPILTSRHLSHDYWVNSTGHGDLIELPDGRWYLVCLGIRNEIAGRSNMGRETHLVPAIWETENPDVLHMKEEDQIDQTWPVCAPETGRVEKISPLPFPQLAQKQSITFSDTFSDAKLKKEWCFRRVPDFNKYQLLPEANRLRVWSGNHIAERGQSSLIGFRQKQSYFSFKATIHTSGQYSHSKAGIGLIQKDDHHLMVLTQKESGKRFISVELNGAELAGSEIASDASTIELLISCDQNGYHCGYIINSHKELIARNISLSSMVSRYYTGAHCCLHNYLTSETDEKEYVEFSDVHYESMY